MIRTASRGRPLGARASRPHPAPLAAAEFPCDPACGNPCRRETPARAPLDQAGLIRIRAHAATGDQEPKRDDQSRSEPNHHRPGGGQHGCTGCGGRLRLLRRDSLRAGRRLHRRSREHQRHQRQWHKDQSTSEACGLGPGGFRFGGSATHRHRGTPAHAGDWLHGPGEVICQWWIVAARRPTACARNFRPPCPGATRGWNCGRGG